MNEHRVDAGEPAESISVAVTTSRAGVRVVHVHGDVVLTESESLERQLSSCLAPELVQVVLDFSAVTFFAGEATQVLLELRRRCADNGTELVLVPGAALLKALTRLGLNTVFDVRADVEHAVRPERD